MKTPFLPSKYIGSTSVPEDKTRLAKNYATPFNWFRIQLQVTATLPAGNKIITPHYKLDVQRVSLCLIFDLIESLSLLKSIGKTNFSTSSVNLNTS